MNKEDFKEPELEMLGYQVVHRLFFKDEDGHEDAYVRVENDEEGTLWYPDGMQGMHEYEVRDYKLEEILEELFIEKEIERKKKYKNDE